MKFVVRQNAFVHFESGVTWQPGSVVEMGADEAILHAHRLEASSGDASAIAFMDSLYPKFEAPPSIADPVPSVGFDAAAGDVTLSPASSPGATK